MACSSCTASPIWSSSASCCRVSCWISTRSSSAGGKEEEGPQEGLGRWAGCLVLCSWYAAGPSSSPPGPPAILSKHTPCTRRDAADSQPQRSIRDNSSDNSGIEAGNRAVAGQSQAGRRRSAHPAGKRQCRCPAAQHAPRVSRLPGQTALAAPSSPAGQCAACRCVMCHSGCRTQPASYANSQTAGQPRHQPIPLTLPLTAGSCCRARRATPSCFASWCCPASCPCIASSFLALQPRRRGRERAGAEFAWQDGDGWSCVSASFCATVYCKAARECARHDHEQLKLFPCMHDVCGNSWHCRPRGRRGCSCLPQVAACCQCTRGRWPRR